MIKEELKNNLVLDLDLRKGSLIDQNWSNEANLVINGDFSETKIDYVGGIGGWLFWPDGPASAVITDPTDSTNTVLRVAPNTTSSFVYQTCLTPGKTYRITGKARSPNLIGGVPRIYMDAGYPWIGQGYGATTEWQYFDFTYTVTTNTFFRLYSSTSVGGVADFDNIVVKEIPQGVATGCKWINGKYGKMVKFNDHIISGTDKITFADRANLQLTEGTILVFGDFKYQSILNNNLVHKRDAGGTNYQFYLDVVKTLRLFNGTSYSSATVDVANASMVGVTFKSGEYPSFYKDGTFVSLGSAALTIVKDDAPLIIGNAYTGNQNSLNPLNQVLIFDTVLTSAQISQAYDEFMKEGHQGIIPQRGFVGNNLLDDGGMENTGVADWKSANATLTKETGSSGTEGSQVLRITGNGAGIPLAYQACCIVGNKYRVVGRARSVDGIKKPEVTIGGLLFSGTTSTSWQNIDFVGTATSVNLSLRTDSSAGGIVEFDNMVCVPYGQPILDAGRIRPTYRNTFEDAKVTLNFIGVGTSSVDLGGFTPVSGTHKISLDVNGKWLENATAGKAYSSAEFAYGTLQFDVMLLANGSLYFDINSKQDTGGNGYRFGFTSTGGLYFVLITTGGQSTKCYSASGVITVGSKYTFRVTRSKLGAWTFYIKGGTEYPNWTNVVWATLGTNPYTENTHSAMTNVVFNALNGGVGKISDINMWKDVLDTTKYPNL